LRKAKCSFARSSPSSGAIQVKASGAQADRWELLHVLKDIMPGDVVTVTRIDRLARSTLN
jgi:DNA invertase Pin-like site-specific DNA recombinase